MGKKKARLSIFSTVVQQINQPSSEYHLIDNEYFAAFNSVDDIQQFHQKLTEKQSSIPVDEDDDELPIEEDMDMKTFAQQYLVDLPDTFELSTEQPDNCSLKAKGIQSDNKKRKSTTPVKFNIETNNKRQRRNIRDLPQSSEFIFSSNKDHRKSSNSSKNIFESLQDETSSTDNVNSIMVTLNNEQAMNNEDSTMFKNEPIESEQLFVEPKEEPIELDVASANPMDFGTSKFTGDLDNYVQNIHLLHHQSSTTSETTTSRPQRIRKRKKFFSEESEPASRSKKLKPSIRKKRPSPPLPSPSLVPLQTSSALQLTDAEIELQFGERLPLIKSEHDVDDLQPTVNSRIIIEFEPVIHSPQTPIEKARAKLTTALGRGHDPDTYLLKIRSREHKIIEVQLAIYSTADWYSHRTKILSKIEEALRGLRVSWTKIDIRVEDFDIQISTSSQTSIMPPPTSVSNGNSSWFLKVLSESGPLIVHIHDRRHPQQRLLIKCSCPECSHASILLSPESSLPVIVNVSPATTPTRRLTPPTILNKTPQANISSLHNIDTTFFTEIIHQWGRMTVISVTQCVLDLALIVSVHASLPSLCVSPTFSKEEYKKKYQQIIDPLKCTLNENEQILLLKSPMIARVVSVNSMANTQSIILSKPPDILTFYNSIKSNKANIRSAKSMRHLITTLFSSSVTSPTQSNLVQTRTLILPKPAPTLSLMNSQAELVMTNFNESNRRSRRHEKYPRDHNETKQQAHCTPIIELKPILGGSNITTSNNEIKKVRTILSTNTEFNETSNEINSAVPNSARVIRLSIAKSALPNQQQPTSTSPPTIRLVTSPKTDSDPSSSHSASSVNKGETVPLVPKQINIIKPLSSSSTSITPAIKLSNPVLIINKPQQPSTK